MIARFVCIIHDLWAHFHGTLCERGHAVFSKVAVVESKMVKPGVGGGIVNVVA